MIWWSVNQMPTSPKKKQLEEMGNRKCKKAKHHIHKRSTEVALLIILFISSDSIYQQSLRTAS